jgi:hypothetical protein
MFAIRRESGYEEIMDALVTKITGIEHFKHHTGCSFVNDTFEIHPYYFGNCLCSFNKKYKEFIKITPHKQDCFMVELNILNDAFKKHPQYINNNKLKAERANEERRLCIAHNIDYKDGKNLSNVCNCGCQESFYSLNHQHEDSCPILLPNFWVKNQETPLKIFWYKTYFRDATCTQELTLDEFKRIIGVCLQSI